MNRGLVTSAIGLALASTSFLAAAAPITTGLQGVFRDNEGANTVGSGVGDNLTVVVRNVEPNLTTQGVATNPQYTGTVPLLNIFTANVGFFSRTFASDVFDAGGTITSPWTVTLTNRNDSLTLTTNSLFGVQQLPLLSNLRVEGDPLTPTIRWDPVSTSVPYDQVRISIYNDRTDQLVVTERFIGGPSTTSYQIPLGTLAPNTDYSYRVFLWDGSGPSGLINRSSTHVNATSTSTAVSSGSVFRRQNGDSSLTLSTGANAFAGSVVSFGVGSPGSATLKSGKTLDAMVLNVGTTNIGSLNVENTTVRMQGGSGGTSVSPQAGFAIVGREAGSLGYLDIFNGGQLLIESNGYVSPGLSIGLNSGSFGTANVDGEGSKISVQGPTTASANALENGVINVGRYGDGRLNIVNGGQVINDAEGAMFIGRFAGSRGSVLVSGAGSVLDAGAFLSIGDVGAGQGSLQIRDGGVVYADSALLGPGGFLGGAGGTINLQGGELVVRGGVVSPGDSPGKLTIVGDLVVESGILLLEAFGLGQIDEILVEGNIFIGAGALVEILLGFSPEDQDPLVFLTATGDIDIAEGFAGPQIFGLLGSEAPFGSLVQVQLGDTIYDVRVEGPAVVPEPGTLMLVVLALLALAYGSWRSRLNRGLLMTRQSAAA